VVKCRSVSCVSETIQREEQGHNIRWELGEEFTWQDICRLLSVILDQYTLQRIAPLNS